MSAAGSDPGWQVGPYGGIKHGGIKHGGIKHGGIEHAGQLRVGVVSHTDR
jgi:hypothetical protein